MKNRRATLNGVKKKNGVLSLKAHRHSSRSVYQKGQRPQLTFVRSCRLNRVSKEKRTEKQRGRKKKTKSKLLKPRGLEGHSKFSTIRLERAQ